MSVFQLYNVQHSLPMYIFHQQCLLFSSCPLPWLPLVHFYSISHFHSLLLFSSFRHYDLQIVIEGVLCVLFYLLAEPTLLHVIFFYCHCHSGFCPSYPHLLFVTSFLKWTGLPGICLYCLWILLLCHIFYISNEC